MSATETATPPERRAFFVSVPGIETAICYTRMPTANIARRRGARLAKLHGIEWDSAAAGCYTRANPTPTSTRFSFQPPRDSSTMNEPNSPDAETAIAAATAAAQAAAEATAALARHEGVCDERHKNLCSSIQGLRDRTRRLFELQEKSNEQLNLIAGRMRYVDAILLALLALGIYEVLIKPVFQ